MIAAGRFDVLAELLCVDRRHLLELTNRVRAIPGVVSTETFPYLAAREAGVRLGPAPRDEPASGDG